MVRISFFLYQSKQAGDKGLVTNYEEWGLQNGRGGGMWSFTPMKRGAEHFLAMLKGGTNSFGVIFMQ